MKKAAVAFALTAAVMLGWSRPAAAIVIRQSCDFRLETWCDIEQSEGSVTIHRARVTTSDLGLRSVSTSTALNDEYLERIAVQIEFTNEGDRKVKSFIKVRWLDSEGTPIDGFGDEEGLDAHRARATVRRSIGALEYGLEKAKKLEIEVDLKP